MTTIETLILKIGGTLSSNSIHPLANNRRLTANRERRLTLIVELMVDKEYVRMGRTTRLKGESGFILLYLAFFDLNLVGGTEAAGN